LRWQERPGCRASGYDASDAASELPPEMTRIRLIQLPPSAWHVFHYNRNIRPVLSDDVSGSDGAGDL